VLHDPDVLEADFVVEPTDSRTAFDRERRR